MAKQFLDATGLLHLWSKMKTVFQEKLVSGTNIKTIDGNNLLDKGDVITTKVKQLAFDTQVGDYSSEILWTSLLTSYTPTTEAQNEEINYVRKSPLLYNHSEGFLVLNENFLSGIALVVGEVQGTSYNPAKSTVIASDSIRIRNQKLEIDEALTEEDINNILV